MSRRKTVELTKAQSRFLDYIREFQRTHLRPARYREIQSALSMGLGGVSYHIEMLREKGYLVKVQGFHYQLMDKAKPPVGISRELCDRIMAELACGKEDASTPIKRRTLWRELESAKTTQLDPALTETISG